MYFASVKVFWRETLQEKGVVKQHGEKYWKTIWKSGSSKIFLIKQKQPTIFKKLKSGFPLISLLCLVKQNSEKTLLQKK